MSRRSRIEFSSISSTVWNRRLLVRILTSGTRKVRRRQIWRVGQLGDNSRLMLRQKFTDKECICQQTRYKILRQHDPSPICRSKSGGKNVYRCLLLRQLYGQLGVDFDESQQALSQRDRRPLTWKVVQMWGRLRWRLRPICNAGTTRDMAYGSNKPLHKLVTTSEKSQ